MLVIAVPKKTNFCISLVFKLPITCLKTFLSELYINTYDYDQ